jgi:MerR family transcriptional regulator, light-induced transcriptional regulator
MAKSLKSGEAGTQQLRSGEHRLTLVGDTPLVEPTTPEARSDLLTTIQEEIIPRLMLAHCADPVRPPPVCADARLPPTPEEVVAFAQLAVDEELASSLAFVEKVCADGLSLEVVLLELIAPAARVLGEQWLDDTRSFTEVTVGLGTLQQLVHVLGPSFAPGVQHRGFIVLLAPQAEQHTLGIYLLGEFLRRAGWGVQVAPSMSDTELLDLVRSEHVEMVGISVSNTDLLAHVAKLIAAVKKASTNPDVAVLLGGPLPELVDYAPKNGATYCTDPRDAVRWLEQHVSLHPNGRWS